MRFLVALKHVIDPMTAPPVADKHSALSDAECDRIINPFDECALEAALRLVDGRRQAAQYENHVSVLTVGPQSTETLLRQAMAVGAAEALRIDASDAAIDGHVVSRVLARAARDLCVDLIILGKASTDEASGEVGQRLGALLGWSQLTAASSIDMLASGQLLTELTVGSSTLQLQTRLPAIISVDRRILAAHAVRHNGKSPVDSAAGGVRYAGLPAIIAARRKPLQVYALAEYVADPESLVRTTKRTRIPEASDCRMLDSVEQLAQSIIRELTFVQE